MSTTIELQDGQRTRNVKGRVFRFGGGGRECICRMVFAYKYEEKLHGKSFKYLDCQLLDLFLKALIWIKTNCGKFLKRWEYQATSPSSWEISMRVRKQQLELDIGQWTGSKLGKEYVKAIYCHLAYLTYMQSTLCEMPGCMKHKLESRLPGEISIISDMQMTPPLWQKAKRN